MDIYIYIYIYRHSCVREREREHPIEEKQKESWLWLYTSQLWNDEKIIGEMIKMGCILVFCSLSIVQIMCLPLMNESKALCCFLLDFSLQFCYFIIVIIILLSLILLLQKAPHKCGDHRACRSWKNNIDSCNYKGLDNFLYDWLL